MVVSDMFGMSGMSGMHYNNAWGCWKIPFLESFCLLEDFLTFLMKCFSYSDLIEVLLRFGQSFVGLNQILFSFNIQTSEGNSVT